MSLSKLIFIGILVAFVEAYRCPAEAAAQIDLCTGPVERSIDAMISSELFQHSGESHQYTSYDRKVNAFQELCREIWDFESCVQGVEHLCSEHKTLNFIQESYGYLCTEEYADFLSYVDCIGRVENGNDACVKKATMETITYRNGTRSGSSNEAACRMLNGFLDCLQPSIEAMCGRRAWNLVEKFFEGARRILLSDCRRREDNNKRAQLDIRIDRLSNRAVSNAVSQVNFNHAKPLMDLFADFVAPLWLPVSLSAILFT